MVVESLPRRVVVVGIIHASCHGRIMVAKDAERGVLTHQIAAAIRVSP